MPNSSFQLSRKIIAISVALVLAGTTARDNLEYLKVITNLYCFPCMLLGSGTEYSFLRIRAVWVMEIS